MQSIYKIAKNITEVIDSSVNQIKVLMFDLINTSQYYPIPFIIK